MTDRRALAILVAVHLAIVALVAPRGDFPLNDDWAYAHSVRWLLDEGRIRLSDWVGMNLVPQTLAGAAVTAAGGFSFETLRHLTQVVAVICMGVAYGWFRTARFEPGAALAATLALVSFPAWPVLANSYMTDLYGLVLALASATFFLKALERPTRWALVAATMFAMAGVLQRQVVLAIPFAFLVAVAWSQRPLDRRALLMAALPFALVLATEAAFQAYLASGPGIPTGQRVAHGRVISMAVKALSNEDDTAVWMLANLANIAGYLGLFAIGWVAWWGVNARARIPAGVIALGGAAIAASAFAFGWFAPYRDGFLVDAAGIGPFLLYDTLRGIASLDHGPGVFWKAVAIPAAFATAAVVACLASLALANVRPGPRAEPGTLFMLLVVLAYLAPFALTDYFDRYFLYVLPFVFVLWARWSGPSQGGWRRRAGLACIAGTIALSAVATRDYFAWNRARWDAIRMAEAAGATPEEIDGGFEYNAWRRFEKRKPQVPAGKSWWWVEDDRYIVAFARVAGYDEIASWSVPHWLPRSPAQVKLLRRSRPAP